MEDTKKNRVDQLLQARKTLTREELTEIVEAVDRLGGKIRAIGWEPGDPICPEIHLKWKPGLDLGKLFDLFIHLRKPIKVFPLGIPVPDGVRIVVGGFNR